MACKDRLAGIAQQLLDCYVVALAECGRPVCRDFLASSASVAWDECCDCGNGDGTAWVNLVSITPRNLGANLTQCAWEYDAVFSLNVIRCAATQDADGTPPPPEVLTAEAVGQMLDAAIQRQAIICCFGENRDPGDYTLGAWNPLGPDGACVGGSTLVTLRFQDCPC